MARIGREQRAELTEARRVQLLDAAVRLCASRGFDAVSVESIAREAGLSKGGVYLYFPTKQAILDAALQRYSLLPEMTELLAAYGDVHPREAIPAIVGALWRALKQRSELIGIFLREVPLSSENSELFLKRIVYPGNGALAAYFAGWMKAGVLRPLSPVGMSGTLLGSLLSFLLIQDVFGGTKFYPIPDEEVVATVSALLLNGALRGTRPRPPSRQSPSKRHPV